jgi:lysozyme
MINPEGLMLIKKHEGIRLKSYRCPAGVWSIGYGSTAGVKPGMLIDLQYAEALLRQDLERFERGVKLLVKVPLNDNQFAALTSFAFNLGLGALAKSTLLKKLNAGDYAAVPEQLMRWNKARNPKTGVLEYSKGLNKRRYAEGMLWSA